MNPDEYFKLNQLEKEHWFYSGKRDIVRYWINTTHPLSPDSLLVDCGAGTGQFACEMQSFCRVIAVDDHDESLEIAKSKLGESSVKRGSCLALPFADQSVDCLTALDVLEHVEDDSGALREFSRVLKPGAIAVITVPALQILWSDWDVSLHHFRRYNRKTLLQLIQKPQFEIVHWNFINVAAFPAVYLSRKFRAIVPTTQRAEDSIPADWLNSILKKSFVSLACQRHFRFPLGVGLLAVLRRNTATV